MNKSRRNFYFLVFLFLIFGLLASHNIMAASCSTDCNSCNSQKSCKNEGPDCVWIKTRSEEYCRRALEIEWPSSPVGTRLDSKSGAAEVIKYLYEWGISLGGMAAFISLIMAGFQYLTSVGEEGKMREARDNIQSSLLGLILLLSAWLILNTLNPQLTLLEKPELESLPLSPGFPVSFPDEELTEPKACEQVVVYFNSTNCEGNNMILNTEGQCTGNVSSPQSIMATKGDCDTVDLYSTANCSAYSLKGSITLIENSCVSISSFNAGEPIRSIRVGENVSYRGTEPTCDDYCNRCTTAAECINSKVGSCYWYNNACVDSYGENLD